MKYIKKGFHKITEMLNSDRKRNIFPVLKSYFWALNKFPSHVPLPTEIQLEVSSFCNLHCQMCTLNNMDYLRRYFPIDKFDDFLDQFSGLASINFTGIGESLMHKDLEIFIKKAKFRGIRTMMITNGVLLTKDRLNSLIESGIDSISISIETADEGEYEKIRRGADFHQLLSVLENISDKQGKVKTVFSLNVCLFKETIKDIRGVLMIIDLAHKYQIKNITFQNTHNAILDINKEIESGFFRKQTEKIYDYAARFNIHCSYPSAEIKNGCCYYPWIYPFITSSGDILPCCIIPQFGSYAGIISQYSFGNIFKDSVKKIWNSSKAIDFRKSLSRNKPSVHCSVCSKYKNIL
jgi:radical SAM protein with 4Fe4S-binding SPASM domain